MYNTSDYSDFKMILIAAIRSPNKEVLGIVRSRGKINVIIINQVSK